MPSWLAAAALTLVGLCNIIGTLGCGLLGQRYPKKSVLSLLYLLRALVFLAFLVVPVSEASVLAFGAAMGFLWLGTVPLTSGLVAQIFGPAYMSTLFGIVFLSHQVGGFGGARGKRRQDRPRARDVRTPGWRRILGGTPPWGCPSSACAAGPVAAGALYRRT